MQPKQRPILFSAPMVRAILEGRKTQTRRVAPIADLNIKANSNDLVTWGVSFTKPTKGVLGSYSGGKFTEDQGKRIIASQFCSYGKPGDRLWVRETWHPETSNPSAKAAYRADCDYPTGAECKWKPSIFMPRWASRITLEITDVRVERLQDISDQDCMAEGITDMVLPMRNSLSVPRNSYADLWESINGPGAWEINPWVWVVVFKQVTT